jgi:hypothetical protein
MIYFCKGCGAGCNGLGKCCDEIGKCLNEVCAPCCKVLDRPLGGYVLLTFIVCIIGLGCAGAGAINEGVKECSKVQLLCFANVALTIIHAGFAIYLQSRLVSGMEKAGGTVSMTGKEILNRAGHIVLYDVGFCVYVFVFIGSWGLNVIGMSWVSACNLDTPLPMFGALAMVLFGMGAVTFAFFFWCVAVCNDCFSPSHKPPPPGAAPRKRRRGLFGFIFGSLFDMGQSQPQRPAQQPQAYGQPVGQPVAVAQPGQPYQWPAAQQQPVPQPVYAGGGQPQPGVAQPAPAPPPPSAAQQVAAGGLNLAGQGLAAAGQWMQQKSSTPATKK